MREATYSRPVNYYETDKMAIVHHSNYIRYFEEARLHHLEQVGISFLGLEEMGLQIPVTEAQCKYHAPARYGDVLDVTARLERFNGVRLTYTYEIYRGETHIASGMTGHAFLNEKGMPISLKRKFPTLYGALMELVGEA